MSLDLIIKGGHVATASARFDADLGIVDGRVAVVAADLDEPASRVIDAKGLIVAPGGIDVHTHFATQVAGLGMTADDFESGTRAAALGGITTIVNHAFQVDGDDLYDAIRRAQDLAAGNCHVDYGFHVGITRYYGPSTLVQLQQLADEGYPSAKVFAAGSERLSDRELLEVLAGAAKCGVIVAVHAEDDGLVEYLSQREIEQGRTSVSSLPPARPPIAEALAVTRVTTYAHVVGCTVYIVHLSSRAGFEAVREARRTGGVYAETRPAYLFLDESCYELEPAVANNYVCTPPLRRPDDQEALWRALREGDIQTYATDHTSWMATQKAGDTFTAIPGGMANVETSLGLLFAEGVARGRLDLTRFVAVTSTNPARLFGLWPRKGQIAVGSDADLVLIDPERVVTVSKATHQSRSDFEAYEGRSFRGWPIATVSRGQVIAEEGQLLSAPGRGELMKRNRCLPPVG